MHAMIMHCNGQTVVAARTGRPASALTANAPTALATKNEVNRLIRGEWSFSGEKVITFLVMTCHFFLDKMPFLGALCTLC